MRNLAAFRPPEFRKRLLRWYEGNHRKLPWRDSASDPYRVWVSEIMLQQTRVEVVKAYYARFIRRFPTVRVLASAEEHEVLALWSGLGYYRRARMIHRAARVVLLEMHGKVPPTAAGLQELPGIGRYTASAIASICFGEVTAVVDGNVERVLRRLTGKTLPAREQWQLANKLISPRRPGDFNQAMMELGATVCTPLDPKCSRCPVNKLCVQQGRKETSPLKRRRLRKSVTYALDLNRDRIRLVQREASLRLMPGMWELPLCDGGRSEPDLTLKHSIVDTEYDVNVIRQPGKYGRYVRLQDLANLPLTGLTRKVLHKARIVI